MTLEAKNIDQPDDKRVFDHGEVRMVRVGDATIGRAVFSPGWRWSADVKPIVGTSSCELAHTAYVVSGRMRVRMNDGTEAEFGPGDAHYVSPGHDAWVVGGEPLVVIDFTGPAQLAWRRVPGGMPWLRRRVQGRPGRPAGPPDRSGSAARERIARS